MKPQSQTMVATFARFLTPLMALFGAVLAFTTAPGGGVGFTAGLAVGLVLALHALTFGAAAARAALPSSLARGVLALGVVVACAGAGLPGLAFAGQLIEGGVFAAMIGAMALLLQVTFGRAPTLRDAE